MDARHRQQRAARPEGGGLPLHASIERTDASSGGSASTQRPTSWSHWLPLFVALVVFAQVAFRGVQPALSESRRLNDAEVHLAARYQQALDTQAELDRRLRAQADPIYLERERRLLLAPHSPLRAPTDTASATAR